MLAMWVKVRIKPDQRKKFLDAIEVDALGSERDEPGCLRFNVLQDEKDPNVYYFFELYKDQDAVDTHGKTEYFRAAGPKFGAVLAGRPDVEYLDGVG